MNPPASDTPTIDVKSSVEACFLEGRKGGASTLNTVVNFFSMGCLNSVLAEESMLGTFEVGLLSPKKRSRGFAGLV